MKKKTLPDFLPDATAHPARQFLYEPGNAMLYRLVVIDYGESLVLAWLNAPNGGKATPLMWDALPPHPLYLAEKFGVRMGGSDCDAIIHFLTLLTRETA